MLPKQIAYTTDWLIDWLTEGLLMTAEPLADDGLLMMTPGTADYFSTPAVHLQHHLQHQQQQQQQHPLASAVQARRAVVLNACTVVISGAARIL